MEFWYADTHFIISCTAKNLRSMFGFSSTKTVVTAQVFSKDLAIRCNIIWCTSVSGLLVVFSVPSCCFSFSHSSKSYIYKGFGLRLKQIFEVPIIKFAQTYILRQRHTLIINNFCCLQFKSRNHSNTGVNSFRNSEILDLYLKIFGFVLFKMLLINPLDGPSVKTTFSRCIFIVQKSLFTPVTSARVDKDSVLIM